MFIFEKEQKTGLKEMIDISKIGYSHEYGRCEQLSIRVISIIENN